MEAEDCVNFAVALARIASWLVHVDWLTPSDEENISELELMRTRYYHESNAIKASVCTKLFLGLTSIGEVKKNNFVQI